MGQSDRGDWSVTAIYVPVGPAMSFGNVLFLGNLQIFRCAFERTVDKYFNTGRASTRTPLSSSRRTIALSAESDGARHPAGTIGPYSYQGIPLKERFSFELRGSLPMLQPPEFRGPNLSPTSANFGKITGQTQPAPYPCKRS